MELRWMVCNSNEQPFINDVQTCKILISNILCIIPLWDIQLSQPHTHYYPRRHSIHARMQSYYNIMGNMVSKPTQGSHKAKRQNSNGNLKNRNNRLRNKNINIRTNLWALRVRLYIFILPIVIGTAVFTCQAIYQALYASIDPSIFSVVILLNAFSATSLILLLPKIKACKKQLAAGPIPTAPDSEPH